MIEWFLEDGRIMLGIPWDGEVPVEFRMEVWPNGQSTWRVVAVCTSYEAASAVARLYR